MTEAYWAPTIRKVDQDELLAGRRLPHTLDPYLSDAIGVSSIQRSSQYKGS